MLLALLALVGQMAFAQGWPPRNGASLPSTCTVGEVYWLTTSSSTKLYECTSTDTWTVNGTGSGGAGGPATWGDIDGTLADQTDLQAALDDKAEADHDHAGTYATASHTHTDADIPNTITIDLAATATALAANPSDCSANQYATAIAANGNLTCAAVSGASASSLGNANTADVTANAADTYLTGSSLTIGARQKAGTIIRWRLMMTKTAAGTAAPVVNVRLGTNGTTGDTARLTFTGVAQTAATDTGWADIEVIVRAINATTGVVHGGVNFQHFNTTTGLANKAQAQIIRATSANFDNTSASLIIGLSVNPGTSGVWTFQHVSAEALNLN